MRVLSYMVAGLATVVAAIPAQQVVANLNQVATLSKNLQTPAKSLSILDGPLLTIGQGNFPPVIQGFTQIVTTATAALNTMNPEQYSGADADLIYDAFRNFVVIHQELLNILIGKAGLFTTVPFIGQPVAAVLRAVEAVVDSLAFSLIDMMQSRQQEMQQSSGALGSTIDTAIKSYSGLSLN